MSYITKRKIKNKLYYYLEESLSGKKKISLSLGSDIPELDILYSKYMDLVNLCSKKGHKVLVPPYTEYITHKWAERLEVSKVSKKEMFGKLSIADRKQFIEREKITFITDSNAIEGSTLNYDQTLNVLSEGRRLEKLSKKYLVTNIQKEEQEAINLNRALDLYDLLQKKKVGLSEKIILNLHLILLSNIGGYDKYKGVYRPVDVYVVGSSFEFPRYYQVPYLMKELIDWYEANKNLVHPIELAAKFHTKFTTIHPFADGNGRIARLLMNYILQMNNFPFTNIPLKKRKKYMKTQADGNKNVYKSFSLFLKDEVILQNSIRELEKLKVKKRG